MLGKAKKLLGFEAKTKAVLLSDVNPATPEPELDDRVHRAVSDLVTSLVDLERKSYAVRQELQHLTLHIVNRRSD